MRIMRVCGPRPAMDGEPMRACGRGGTVTWVVTIAAGSGVEYLDNEA
jgi:hypothetical protein